MKYAYVLTNKNGLKIFSIQDYKFDPKEVLEVHKHLGYVKCVFHKNIPNGYHLCGCGNLARGTKDELCEECQEIYGHTYEHEL